MSVRFKVRRCADCGVKLPLGSAITEVRDGEDVPVCPSCFGKSPAASAAGTGNPLQENDPMKPKTAAPASEAAPLVPPPALPEKRRGHVPDKFVRLKLSELRESDKNPRKSWDMEALKELSATITRVGIREPLLVREVGNGKGEGYEIVAGARRYRAAKMAGLEEVPCLVQDLTEEEAVEVMMIENLQRKDLTAIEEGQGYRDLLDRQGGKRYTVKDIAAQVGRSIGYVYARLKLLDAVPEVRKALLERTIEAGQGVLLARLEPETQKKYLKFTIEQGTSVHVLADIIQRDVHLSLSAAPWKWEDESLVAKAGPCTTCPHRTTKETHPDLKENTCLKPSCYEEKTQAFANRKAAALAADLQKKSAPAAPATGSAEKRTSIEKRAAEKLVEEKAVAVRISSRDPRYMPKESREEGTLYIGEWVFSGGKSCQNLRVAVVDDDQLYDHATNKSLHCGRIVEVCENPKGCPVHKPKEDRAAKKTPAQLAREKKTRDAEALRQAMEKRTIELLVRKVGDTDWVKLRPDLEAIAGTFFARVWGDRKRVIFAFHGWEAKRAGNYGGIDYDSVVAEHIRKMNDGELMGFLFELHLQADFSGEEAIEKAAKRHKITPAVVKKSLEDERRKAETAKEKAKAQEAAKEKAKLKKHQKRG